MKNTVTRLFHINQDGKRYVMNTITATSKFHGFNTPKDLYLESQRQICAEIIRDGWIVNGQMKGTWEIVHGQPDPNEFSKVTEELMSRV